MNYHVLVTIKKVRGGYGVFSPTFPDCNATGKTIEKAVTNMQKALEAHLKNMIDDGDILPADDLKAFYKFLTVHIPDA